MVTLRCKLVVVGASTVGKSCLCQMFHSNGTTFAKNYVMTDGVELSVKPVHIPDSEVTVELYIHDVSGHELYDDMVPSLIEGFNAFMLVFDTTSPESFRATAKWLDVLKQSRPEIQNVPCVVVANKIDLKQRQAVSLDEAAFFAQRHGLQLFLSSALTGEEVDTPFNFIATLFYRMYCEQLKDIAAMV